jgi:hypothetical protein
MGAACHPVSVGSSVGIAMSVGVSVGDGVNVAVLVSVFVGVRVSVDVGGGVNVAVLVGVFVGVSVDVLVGINVSVGVLVGADVRFGDSGPTLIISCGLFAPSLLDRLTAVLLLETIAKLTRPLPLTSEVTSILSHVPPLKDAGVDANNVLP